MDMTYIDRCSSCGTPLDPSIVMLSGKTICTPCRREMSRAVVPTVSLPPSRPAEHGDIVRPVLNREAHRRLDFDLEGLEGVDLYELVGVLHRAINVAAANPSAADGFPTSVPGAAPSTTITMIDLGPTFEGDDEHGPVNLTPVEAAVHARALARRDKFDHQLEQTLAFFGDASRALRAAANGIAQLAKLQQDAGLAEGEQGCWALARVGSWEPVRSTVVVGGEPRPLGRWAYDFHRSTGRLPSIPECRAHVQGKRVVITKAKQRTGVAR